MDIARIPDTDSLQVAQLAAALSLIELSTGVPADMDYILDKFSRAYEAVKTATQTGAAGGTVGTVQMPPR